MHYKEAGLLDISATGRVSYVAILKWIYIFTMLRAVHDTMHEGFSFQIYRILYRIIKLDMQLVHRQWTNLSPMPYNLFLCWEFCTHFLGLCDEFSQNSIQEIRDDFQWPRTCWYSSSVFFNELNPYFPKASFTNQGSKETEVSKMPGIWRRWWYSFLYLIAWTNHFLRFSDLVKSYISALDYSNSQCSSRILYLSPEAFRMF